jgi:hypothetical protein
LCHMTDRHHFTHSALPNDPAIFIYLQASALPPAPFKSREPVDLSVVKFLGFGLYMNMRDVDKQVIT